MYTVLILKPNSWPGSLQAGAGPDQHGPPPDRQRVEGLRASAQVRGQSLQVQAAEEGRPGQDGHHHEAPESVSSVSGAGRVMEVLHARVGKNLGFLKKTQPSGFF